MSDSLKSPTAGIPPLLTSPARGEGSVPAVAAGQVPLKKAFAKFPTELPLDEEPLSRRLLDAVPPPLRGRLGGGESQAPAVEIVSSSNPGFSATRAWIFDLDNTLYPSACNLFAQVDHRMASFIVRLLGVPLAQARHLQKTYYYQFGTTLAGLMRIHKVAPEAFLDYVHDIDVSVVREDAALAAAIAALPGRKLIFTNGSRRHAERVAERLGVLSLFEDICDIAACDYLPKPSRAAFDLMTARHGVAPEAAAMFEDMPQNLEVPHALGMTTVLVHSSYLDHPAQIAAAKWTEPPPYIHHRTDDLGGFLRGLIREMVS